MRNLKITFTKIVLTLLVIGCVASTVFLKIQRNPRQLIENRVKLVDNIGDNFLFRGGNPFTSNKKDAQFSYEQLSTIFTKTALEKNYTLSDFTLIDISLLDLDEYNQIAAERKFFAQNPDKGDFVNISTIAPGLLFAGFEADFLTDNYHKLITKKLKKIHHLLSKEYEKPLVIYLHCNGGRDRTGFMSAAYKMFFLNIPAKEAIKQNELDVGRNSEGFYEDAIISYCHYLQKNYSKPSNFCDVAK